MVWLVDIVLPIWLQPSSSSSLLALPLGSTGLVQWLAVSICICTGQVLVEPLREQPYQVPNSKCFFASAIVSWFGVCRWDGSLGGEVSGRPGIERLCILCTIFHPCSSQQRLRLDMFLSLPVCILRVHFLLVHEGSASSCRCSQCGSGLECSF